MSYISVHEECVKEEWIDYNGHMNVAFYVLVFDHGTDEILEQIGLGEDYRKKENKSVFVVESHITYEQEVKKGDALIVKSRLLSHDLKRLHIFHEMYCAETGEKCATNEIMALHVDMKLRKTAEMYTKSITQLDRAVERSLENGWPEGSGKSIKKLTS